MNKYFYIQRAKFTNHKGEITGIDQLLEYERI